MAVSVLRQPVLGVGLCVYQGDAAGSEYGPGWLRMTVVRSWVRSPSVMVVYSPSGDASFAPQCTPQFGFMLYPWLIVSKMMRRNSLTDSG